MTCNRLLFSLLLSLPLFALTGCSSPNTGKYFDRDGPPSKASSSIKVSLTSTTLKLKIEKPASGPNKPYKVMGKRYYPITGDQPMTQTGVASWYGKQFHGRKTSTGEVYNMFSLTAAHKTMELPSYAKVTNLENGRSLIVRINDRGPFIGTRIIDLSYAAAVRLGYDKKGTAKVRVERITRAQIARGDIPRADNNAVTVAQTSSEKSSEASDKAGALSTAVATQTATLVKNRITERVFASPSSPSAEIRDRSGNDSTSPISGRDSLPENLAIVPSAEEQPQENAIAQISSVPDTVSENAPDTSLKQNVEEELTPQEPADPIQSLIDNEPKQNVTAKEPAEAGTTDGCSPCWSAQIGAYNSEANANEATAHAEMMLSENNISTPVRVVQDGGRYRVLLGAASTSEQARNYIACAKNVLGINAFMIQK